MNIDFIKENYKVFLSFGTKTIAIVINLLFFYVLARFLTVEEFGIFQFLMTSSVLLLTFLSLGLDHKLFLEASKATRMKIKKIRSEIVTSIIGLNIIVIIFILSIGIFIGFNQQPFYYGLNKSIVILFFLSIPFIVTNSILFNILNGCGRNVIYIFFSGPFQNLLIAILIMCNFFPVDLYNVLFFYLFAVVLNSVSLLWFSKEFIFESKIDFEKFFNLIRESFNLYKYFILNTLIVGFDIFLIKMLGDNYELGLYSFANKFSILISIFFTTSTMYFMPSFIQKYHEGKFEELKKIYHNSTLFIIFVILVPFLFLFFFTYDLIYLFDPKFSKSVSALKILLIAHFIGLIFGPNALLLFYTQNNNKLFIYTLLSFIFYILFAYNLFFILGIEGVAFSYLLYVLIWKLITSFYFKKVFNFYPIPLLTG